MNRDLDIKTMQLSLTETSSLGTVRTKQITITEKDKIDLEFKYKVNGAKKTRVYGEVLKIGIDDDNRTYIVIIAYNYSAENVFKVHTDEIVKVTNIVHSTEPYSFQPIINPDETAILIKAVDGILFYSADGEKWVPAGGSGTGDDSGKAYVETGTINESSTSDTVPTSNVVYATIIEQINLSNEDVQQQISNLNLQTSTNTTDINNLNTALENHISDNERSFSTITDSFNTALGQRDTRISEVENSVSSLITYINNLQFDDFYAVCEAQGWNGTREDFAAGLVTLVNHILAIPVIEDNSDTNQNNDNG